MANVHLCALASGIVLAAGWSSTLATPQCPGDADGSGFVDFDDLNLLLINWGANVSPGTMGDEDGDGDVDFDDLNVVLSAWAFACPPDGVIIRTQLAGHSLLTEPHFDYVRAINVGRDIEVAINPARFPDVVGETFDLYVMSARNASQWDSDPTLTDLRPLPQTETITGATVPDATFTLFLGNALPGDAGTSIGVGYDIILDMNQNGTLDAGDYIDADYDDGQDAPDQLPGEAGFYVCKDLTTDGPLATATALDYDLAGWPGLVAGRTRQRTVYPADIATIGPLPLIVISHGNGHQYTWYDYLQQHLASHGYVVMCNQNDTIPGIETASTTTLVHTEAFIGNLDSIGGGVLDGNVDTSQIIWIGHSRGGEGVARAYTRLADGNFVPTNYTSDDIVLVSSIAPNNSLGPGSTQPYDVNYHLIWGSADGDISGAPNITGTHSFSIYERAYGFRQSTYVHGADHNDFNCCGFQDFTGPGATELGRTEVQRITRVVYLALIKRYQEGNIPALDYLTRQWESLQPLGVSSGDVIVNDYKGADISDKAVIDDFQSNSATGTSSSGGAVTFDVTNLSELNMQETTGTYGWTVADQANGMSRGVSSDNSRGAVFDWSGGLDRFYQTSVIPAFTDFTAFTWLSFRACQGTQHPNTTAALEDLTFSVSLIDGSAESATLNIGTYGGGIEEVYQRSGGWQNEFETVRIRLTDFLASNTDLDLTDIQSIRFTFGTAFGSPEGRLGFDDIELTNDETIITGGPLRLSLVGAIPSLVPPDASFTIDVRIREGGETLVGGSPTVFYRYDIGSFSSAPLSLVGGEIWQATLPAPTCASSPEFYFSAEGDLSGMTTLPANAPVETFMTSVGTVVESFSDDFEANLGWTVGSAADDATTGIWTRVNPNGTDAQPEDDHTDSGVTCFVTGQGAVGGGLGDNDVDGGQTTLTSPVIDVTSLGPDARIGYWRWYSNTTGASPNADVFVIDINNGGSWVNVETVGPTGDGTSGGWIYHEFRIADFVTPNSTIQMRFIASDEGSGSIVEAAIDDFVAFAVECN